MPKSATLGDAFFHERSPAQRIEEDVRGFQIEVQQTSLMYHIIA